MSEYDQLDLLEFRLHSLDRLRQRERGVSY